MTTNIAFSQGDGHITSSSTSYTTAQNGSNLVVTGAGATNRMGQNKVGSNYEIYEAFYAYPYTVDSSVVIVAAYFDFFAETTYGTGLSKNWGVRAYNWNEPLGTDNWRTVPQIVALSRIGYAGGASAVQNRHVYAAEDSLNDYLTNNNATMQVIVYNDRITNGNVPSGAEYVDIRSVEASGTSTDPCLVWSTVGMHPLVRVGGSAIELSDGRHVYLEANGGGDSGLTLTLKLHDGTTASTIASNLVNSAHGMGTSNPGFQHYALTRDNSDNIYWVGHANGGGNTLNIVCWKKTGTSTWQEMTFRQADMPSWGSIINNLAMAWHNVGVGGTLAIFGSHEAHAPGASQTNEMFYALINCDRILTGNGTLLRGSGSMLSAGLVKANTSSTDFNQMLNPVGNGLDAAALPNSNTRGVVVSHARESKIGDYAPVSIARYQLDSTYATLAYAHLASQELWSTKDAGGKIRVLPISESRFAVVTLDMDSGWGPTIYIIQNIGTSTTFTTLGSVLLHGEGITSLPTPANIDDSNAWDALYQPEENVIWFYYFDAASQYRLMRTAFDLDTYKAIKNEIQVSASVVGSGTNHAIRVDRGRLMKSEALVTVANRSSGGTQTNTYIVDKLNVSPLAPTLVDRTNFDATLAAIFDWTFNDPNPGDTQTAFQLVIENSDTLAVAHDTGKVTSAVSDRTVAGGTLANGNNYRWKVRTWDTLDSVGPYSAYDFFVTAAGGTVTITSPAADNPTPWLFDDVTITWSTSGITQASYRIRVVRTDTGAQLSDTGFITSTATSASITGLLSDVEQRIELTVRNSALISSNTALRLITPNYNEPETPLVSISSLSDGGYNLISVVNPIPTGDRPNISYNAVQRKKPDDTEWVTIASISAGSDYRDYAVASNETYQYQVVAVAPIGSAASVTVEVTLQLLGVWLHRPYDPEGSAVNFMYGANQRSDQHQSYHQLTHYAGREFPVADFAHYHDDATSVTVDIPFGVDSFGREWAAQIAMLRSLETTHEALVLRDNRGRHSFGVMIGLNFTDMPWGTQANWDHQRVDYDEDVT